MSVNVIAVFFTDEMEPITDIHPETDLHELVNAMEDLDILAEEGGFKPLSSFMMPEEDDGEAEDHPTPQSIKQGLKTVRALVGATSANPDSADLTEELRALERCLTEGAQHGSRFFLMLG